MAQPRPGTARGVLRRPSANAGFRHERVAPSPALEPFVAHYWSVAWDLRGKPPFDAETLPHPCVQVVFEGDRAEVAGVPTRVFRRRLLGRGRVFGIKFRPAAFHPILRAPLSSITDRILSLRTVFGKGGDLLKDAILARADLRRCMELAETFLKSRVPPMPAGTAAIRDLVERLAADHGITRVEQAAALSGMKLRTLQRRFTAEVGVSPKWVINRYRLHQVAEKLARSDAPGMADLALELGYFDQSHFIRSFKSVVGRPPGRYVPHDKDE